MCSLRDVAKELESKRVKIFGVSLDDVATQSEFVKAQKLNFALLSDPDGSVASKYGVLMGGRPMARRVTFLIDPGGVVRHVTTKVNVRSHGQDMVELIGKQANERAPKDR